MEGRLILSLFFLRVRSGPLVVCVSGTPPFFQPFHGARDGPRLTLLDLRSTSVTLLGSPDWVAGRRVGVFYRRRSGSDPAQEGPRRQDKDTLYVLFKAVL